MLNKSRSIITVLLSLLLTLRSTSVEPIPDRLVVLTFDDSVASHATFVALLFKKYGFGATSFITEVFEFNQDKEHYMTWAQIKLLDACMGLVDESAPRVACVDLVADALCTCATLQRECPTTMRRDARSQATV